MAIDALVVTVDRVINQVFEVQISGNRRSCC